jgi:ABC-type spermidine/putrescine transport system permease subunit I
MRWTATISVSLLLIVLSLLTLYPLATLLYGSLHTTPPGVPGEFNLNGYKEVLSAQNFRILLDTLGIALLKTAIAVSLAVLFAWIVARTDTPGRRALEVLIALPFFIPPVITATAWTVLGNPQVGTINLVWRWLTGTDGTIINVYSYFGVIWHMVQYSTPFIFLFIVDAFRAFDPALEESSRMSGASRAQTFRRITLMLLLPIITSALILSFMRGMEGIRIAAHLWPPGQYLCPDDGDFPRHQRHRRAARVSICHCPGLLDPAADVSAGVLAMVAARRPQLSDGHRQRILTGHHEARQVALDHVLGLRSVLYPGRGSAVRSAARRFVFPPVRLLQLGHADPRTLPMGVRKPSALARVLQHHVAGNRRRHRHR